MNLTHQSAALKRAVADTLYTATQARLSRREVDAVLSRNLRQAQANSDEQVAQLGAILASLQAVEDFLLVLTDD